MSVAKPSNHERSETIIFKYGTLIV